MLLSAFSGLVVIALMASSSLGAPRARPQWTQEQGDQEINEVWAPGPSSSPHKHFDRFSFKTLIKALVSFSSPDKTQKEGEESFISSDSPLLQDFQNPTVSPEELSGDPALVTVSEDLLGVPTLAPLEDDSLNIQPIVKPDKSNRFTHNFRFGYGALPGLP